MGWKIRAVIAVCFFIARWCGVGKGDVETVATPAEPPQCEPAPTQIRVVVPKHKPVWIPGHWKARPNRWVWVEGRWVHRG